MVRKLAGLGLALILAACGPDRAEVSYSTQSSNDTRVAKHLFGAVAAASNQQSESFGSYARGCQAGAEQLPQTGQTWQAMRLSRNRNWGQPRMIDYLEDLSRFAATLPGWEGLYVGDISQPRGGPMTSGHASHQIGLDADIWLLPPDRLNLSEVERENLSSISLRRQEGAFINEHWTPEHTALLKAAASDPRVARIFIFPGAKVEMCRTAGTDREWLRKVRPWWGHHYHFHVRLNCAPGDSACENQAPPPPGDGCDDAQGWVDRILNPPPPDPDAPAPTPRADLTMADLPNQCAAVLASD